jgi:hypothetical protein
MHFLIAGDSWSQGEMIVPFIPGPKHKTIVTQQEQQPIYPHKGLHQYLEESGHVVTNVGIGGSSNTAALDQVVRALWSDIDHLVYFYTDPLRHPSSHELLTKEPFFLIDEHIKYVTDTLLDISKQNPTLKITLIGGCSCLPTELVDIATHAVSSVTELVCPGFVDTPYMLSGQWQSVIKNISPNALSVQQKEQYSLIISEATRKLDFWKNNKEFFWPDGQHANRLAHRVLFDHLVSLWK